MAPLPAVLVLTDRAQCDAAGRSLVETVAALGSPVDTAVVLREKDLSPEERTVLGTEVAGAARNAGLALFVASDPVLADRLDAVGLHLAASDPHPAASAPSIVGRSCHDEHELARAITEGVDYVTMSPVFPSGSKPGHGPASGLEGLRAHCEQTTVPVLALGGVTPANAAGCIRAGAVGVAVMGAVMGAVDPGDVVAGLVASVEATRARTVPGAEPRT